MKKTFTAIIFLFILACSYGRVFAQDFAEGVATWVEIIDENVQEGDIISSSNQGFVLSKIPNDPQVYGIVNDHPSADIQNTSLVNARPVVFSGKVSVRVSTKNGVIQKGDYITTSDIPGVGVKAVRSGYIVGLSIDEYTNPDPTAIGKVVVSLNLGSANPNVTAKDNLFDIFTTGVTAPRVSPLDSLRYLLAAFVTVASFILGFIFFGRTARTGVEALGRNPLAARMITFGIALHIIMMIGIMLIGLGISFLILRL